MPQMNVITLVKTIVTFDHPSSVGDTAVKGTCLL